MKKSVRSTPLTGLVTLLLMTLAGQPANAEDEFRAGAVVQVPFNVSSLRNFFDPAAIRIGLTCQYADVEQDDITITRHIYLDPDNIRDPEVTETVTGLDKGNRVYGLEGNVFVEAFNHWNVSVELLGFYGNNEVQGGLGAGYSFSNDFFLDAKAMFPYSEIGVRFLNGLEIYGGGKSLGEFHPAKEYRRVTITEPFPAAPGGHLIN